MASCANCGQAILFGGVKQGTLRFCNQRCYNAARQNLNLDVRVPEDEVEEAATAFHQGDCPCCGGPGPVDFHFSYRVMSFLVFTQFQTIPKISCRSCAQKSKIGNLLVTLFLGWWGVPFGLIITPVYLCKNIYSIFFPVADDTPSDQLREFVRSNIAQQYAAKTVADSDMPFTDAGS